MKRLLIAGAAFVIALGTTGLAGAQPYPASPSGPAMTYTVVRVIPNGSTDDTTRRNVSADPGCGAANPQGGIPTSVTWGDCP